MFVVAIKCSWSPNKDGKQTCKQNESSPSDCWGRLHLTPVTRKLRIKCAQKMN